MFVFKKNIKRFLNDGDKAKITIRFKGRELAHKEIGMKQVERIEKDLEEIPESIREEINFIPVSHMDQVLEHALVYPQ